MKSAVTFYLRFFGFGPLSIFSRLFASFAGDSSSLRFTGFEEVQSGDASPTLSPRSGSSFSVLFQSRLPLRSSCSSNGPGMPQKGYKKIHPFPRNEPFAQDKLQSQFHRRTSVRAQLNFDSTGCHPHYSPCDSSPLNFHFDRHHVSQIGHSQASESRSDSWHPNY